MMFSLRQLEKSLLCKSESNSSVSCSRNVNDITIDFQGPRLLRYDTESKRILSPWAIEIWNNLWEIGFGPQLQKEVQK